MAIDTAPLLEINMSDFEQAWEASGLRGYADKDDFKAGWDAAIASMQGEAEAWRITVLRDDGSVNGKPIFSHDKDYSDETLRLLGEDGYESVRHELFTYPPSASAEIARLTKELEEARKDAERYRWLLDNCQFQEPDGCLSLHFKTDRPAKMRPAGLRHFWINEDIGTAIKNHNHKKETL